MMNNEDADVTQDEWDAAAVLAQPLLDRATELYIADHENGGHSHHDHLPIMNDDGFMCALASLFQQKLPSEVIEAIRLDHTIEMALYLAVAAMEPRTNLNVLLADVDVSL